MFMSEYQYYEFQAIDRDLTDKEMSELRAFSTRADITPNSFVNEYAWGSFKGDEDLWMEKYFDGFLYYANWRTHILKLRLPSALINFAEFLRIDSDLIDAASKTSPSLEEITPSPNNLRTWLATLSPNEKENLLVDILEGSIKGDQAPAMQLVHRFNKMWQSQRPKMGKQSKQRTVAELLKEAEYTTQQRQRMQAEKAAAEKAERQRLNKLAREKRLNEIAGRESILWNQIESFTSEKKAASYDKAIELLIDLRDLAARGDRREFLLKFDALKQRHSSKSSFIGRLRNLDLSDSTANV
jgi:hypothetical protein